LEIVKDEAGAVELAYVADPDGTWVELIQHPDSFPLD
jgi:hypothetical protein